MVTPANVDEYIYRFPKDVQEALKQVRQTIKQAAPGATEVLSYNMPAYKLNGMLVWFSAYTNHIGFYPRASPIAALSRNCLSTNMQKVLYSSR
jgi:uncharacterized protein YdhG (YjbR/CyaY superfamily)